MDIEAYYTENINTVQADMVEYINLCLSYPLVFFEENNIIAFYSTEIELEPKEFQLLKILVKNKTQKKETGKPFGISPKTLCNKIGCNPRDSKKIESNYYMRRITKYKSDIFTKIKKRFLYDPDDEQKGYKALIENDGKNKRLKGCLLSIDSPYYNFNLFSAINNLIYFTKNRNSNKVCTNFYFSDDIKQEYNILDILENQRFTPKNTR